MYWEIISELHFTFTLFTLPAESITIKSLKEIERVLDMQLVYGFVPNDGSLDALIEKRATELATKIVMRTSNTMKLEDQGNSNERIIKSHLRKDSGNKE